MTRYRIMTFDPQGVAVPSFDSLESESPFPNLLGNGEFWAEITEPDHVHDANACEECDKIYVAGSDEGYQQGDADHDHSGCSQCDEVYDRGYEDGKVAVKNDH